MSRLRFYQTDARKRIEQAWADGHANVMLVLPTGAGKTVVTGDTVRAHVAGVVSSLNRGSTCVIAHRQELVSQLSMALNREGVKHRIVAPPKIIKSCVRLHMEDVGKSYFDASAQTAVAGVDTLIRRDKELSAWAAGVSLWVTDECFPAGTLIDRTPIEHIRVGDLVTAFNEQTGRLEKRKVVRLFKNPSPERVCILYISGNKTITSTFNHPYFTKRGWVNAIDLLHSDRILEVCKNGKTRWRRTWAKGVTRGDGFVYNIEVEGLHTYTANGIVVHNCHHVLEENKWGKATSMFPNAKGLGVTATPRRADGKGLGSASDGVFDTMIEGVTMRELINLGYLVDYRVFAPPSDLDLRQVAVSKTTGDYNHDQVVAAIRKSHIVGDVVDHYLRIAKGKRGITFATDVQTAHDIADKFNQAGIPAKAVSANTPDIERYQAVRDLAKGKLLQLINVDLFGEGTDVPVAEVVSFARPTESLSLHIQQAGRVLRLFLPKEDHEVWETLSPLERKSRIAQSVKPHAIIIDHVGNVIRHGLPDAPRAWSLDRRETRGKSKAVDETIIPVRACPSCTMVYERIYKACPHCGFEPVPAGRSSLEQVDGDLMELDAETLARMRGEVAVANMTIEEKREELARKHVPYIGQLSQVKRHSARLDALNVLKETMAVWGGLRTAEGRSDSEIQRLFYHRFGVDVLSAQALSTADAEALTVRVAMEVVK